MDKQIIGRACTEPAEPAHNSARGCRNATIDTMSTYDVNTYNIMYLALCWAWTLTTSTLLTFVGPLTAQMLGASEILAPFTVGAFLFGAAGSSIPSAYLFKKLGRRGGFSIGCACQVMGSVLGCVCLAYQSLPVLYIACLFIGLGQGFGQFYRFSAVEFAPPDGKAWAVTTVLSGGILAAFLGPSLGLVTNNLFPIRYSGGYMMMGLLGIINQVTVLQVKFPIVQIRTSDSTIETTSLLADPPRHVLEIIKTPLFILSCSMATISHSMMIMLMSNVAIRMEMLGYSFLNQAFVLNLHFFSMYCPGFVTGKLMTKYGALSISMLGCLVYGVSLAVFGTSSSLWSFYVGMSLIGIGWNFSFSAATVMLTYCYTPLEAPGVQGVNDAVLFGISGSASLFSGLIVAKSGWQSLIYVIAGLLGVYVTFFGIANIYKVQIDQDVNKQENNRVASANSQTVTNEIFSPSIVEMRESSRSGGGGGPALPQAIDHAISMSPPRSTSIAFRSTSTARASSVYRLGYTIAPPMSSISSGGYMPRSGNVTPISEGAMNDNDSFSQDTAAFDKWIASRESRHTFAPRNDDMEHIRSLSVI